MFFLLLLLEFDLLTEPRDLHRQLLLLAERLLHLRPRGAGGDTAEGGRARLRRSGCLLFDELLVICLGLLLVELGLK